MGQVLGVRWRAGLREDEAGSGEGQPSGEGNPSGKGKPTGEDLAVSVAQRADCWASRTHTLQVRPSDLNLAIPIRKRRAKSAEVASA